MVHLGEQLKSIQPEPSRDKKTPPTDEVGKPIWAKPQEQTGTNGPEKQVVQLRRSAEEALIDLEHAETETSPNLVKAWIGKARSILENIVKKKIDELSGLDSYLGCGLSNEQKKLALEKLETDPKIAEQFQDVRLAITNEQKIKDSEGVRINFIVQAENLQTGEYENTGDLQIQIFPKNPEKTAGHIELEGIEVFDGFQHDSISEGSFRGQGIGPLATIALIKYLNNCEYIDTKNANQQNGEFPEWTAGVAAENRAFNVLTEKLFNMDVASEGWNRLEGHLLDVETATKSKKIQDVITKATNKRQQLKEPIAA